MVNQHQIKLTVILTPREIEVARLMVQNKSTKQIADELHISQRTVEVHRVSIFKKLGTKSKREQLSDILNQRVGLEVVL